MPFCRKCGQQVDDSYKICPMCGAIQYSETNSVHYSETDDETHRYYEEPQEKKKTKSSSDNVNLFCLFSFLCAIVIMFIPIIQKSLILIVGGAGIGLGLTAMIKKKPAASSLQNYVLPILSIFMCLGAIIYAESKWNDLLSIFK